MRRWVDSKTDVGEGTLRMYRWASPHIERGIGGIRLDRLDREDVSQFIDDLASGGHLSRRSVQICRMVLRAALADAVEEGLIRRSPAARVSLPKTVAKPGREHEAEAWDDDETRRFLAAVDGHRWAVPLRVAVLYGLRRSELLALKWDDIDFQAETLRVDEGLVPVHNGYGWSNGKTAASRRTFGVDEGTMAHLARHKTRQLEERLLVGPEWREHNLVVATHYGKPVIPHNFSVTFNRLVAEAGVPRLTTHGLRHTAATHMVRNCSDIGKLRAAAQVLGHSPDRLIRTYAHALPDSLKAVADKIGRRAAELS